MYDWNGSIRSLNVGLPDDIARLKAAGYYQEAIARIDRLLAEDWTKTQNGPASNGIAPPEGYVPPENPTPHGVDALRERCAHLVIVTNDIFSDGITYDEITGLYQERLGIINQNIAAEADAVTEVVCGIPLQLKRKGNSL